LLHVGFGKTIGVRRLLTEEFVCNLSKCRGACCVAGDAGAPLDQDEVAQMEAALPAVHEYMRPEGWKIVKKQGVAIQDPFGPGLVTPLINNEECSFVVFDEKGSTKCSFELAHRDGKTDFLKPISCHLYPIRILDYDAFQALNYHQWDICSPACDLGSELKVPVYKFAEPALRRKFGDEWFDEFEKVAEAWSKKEG